MNKIIKEEINRIREVMGLKLLNESVIPAGAIKTLLSDFAQTVGKNLDDITQAANQGAKKASIVGLYDGLKNSTDQSIKNFVDSLDEVAGSYNKKVNDLLDEITSGKIADEIQEEIFTKMASKTAGVDPNLLNLLPKNETLRSLYDNTSSYYTKYDDISYLKKIAENPDELEYLKKINGSIQNQISILPEGPFRTQLQKSWDEQLEYFNKNIIGKGGDEIKLDIPPSDTPDEQIDEMVEDVTLTAEEKVAQIIKSEKLDLSDAAQRKKKTEIYESLVKKPENKWTAEDFAWVQWLTSKGLLSEAENKALFANLPTMFELADLMRAYDAFKNTTEKNAQNFKTFDVYLKGKGYKIPSFWQKNGARLFNWFKNITEPYLTFLNFKFDKEWLKSAGKTLLHSAVIISGAFASLWLASGRVAKKAAKYFDTWADLDETKIQQALNEFFEYRDPQINGKDIYTSDADGEFNAQYKESPPQIDKIINADDKSISLKSYVMVDSKYCRGFIFEVSQSPLAGGENYLPHKMTSIPSLCTETPDPKYMPGASTPPNTQQQQTTVTPITDDEKADVVRKLKEMYPTGDYGLGDYPYIKKIADKEFEYETTDGGIVKVTL